MEHLLPNERSWKHKAFFFCVCAKKEDTAFSADSENQQTIKSS